MRGRVGPVSCTSSILLCTLWTLARHDISTGAICHLTTSRRLLWFLCKESSLEKGLWRISSHEHCLLRLYSKPEALAEAVGRQSQVHWNRCLSCQFGSNACKTRSTAVCDAASPLSVGSGSLVPNALPFFFIFFPMPLSTPSVRGHSGGMNTNTRVSAGSAKRSATRNFIHFKIFLSCIQMKTIVSAD